MLREIPGQQLPDWLSRRAADMPDRPAVIAGSAAWSFAALDAAAETLATRLAARGVGPGDRVAALLTNGPPYAVLVHALTRLGAILVGLNTRLAAPELAWQIAHVRARLLIHDPLTAALAQSAHAAPSVVPTPEGTWAPDHVVPLCALAHSAALDNLLPDDKQHPEGSRGAQCRADPSVAPTPEDTQGSARDAGVSPSLRTHIDLAAAQSIMFTSGTTGRPKGALLTYGNHWWSAVASALNLGLHADDRWLICLPLFHVGGLAILFRSVIYGMPVVFPDEHPHAGPRDAGSGPPGAGPTARGFDPDRVNQAIAAHGVTLISLVSAQLQRMLDAGDALGAGDLSRSARAGFWRTLRCVLLGGGPAPRPLLETCAARGIAVAQTYGLTETASQAVTLAPAEALRKLGSAGRPLLTTELRILPDGSTINTDNTRRGTGHRDNMEEETAISYAAGEILVRGPTVTPGYLPPDGDPATPIPATDAEGWLHTGDLGYLDAEGYLYVLDRRDDLIISGGENVYPAEVEAILLAHPAVAEAGVYGVPDPRWGQSVAATIVLRPGAFSQDVPHKIGGSLSDGLPPQGGAEGAPEEILAFCRARLAGYKVPRQIRFAAALPRNAAGKLLRRRLREQD